MAALFFGDRTLAIVRRERILRARYVARDLRFLVQIARQEAKNGSPISDPLRIRSFRWLRSARTPTDRQRIQSCR